MITWKEIQIKEMDDLGVQTPAQYLRSRVDTSVDPSRFQDTGECITDTLHLDKVGVCDAGQRYMEDILKSQENED